MKRTPKAKRLNAILYGSRVNVTKVKTYFQTIRTAFKRYLEPECFSQIHYMPGASAAKLYSRRGLIEYVILQIFQLIVKCNGQSR